MNLYQKNKTVTGIYKGIHTENINQEILENSLDNADLLSGRSTSNHKRKTNLIKKHTEHKIKTIIIRIAGFLSFPRSTALTVVKESIDKLSFRRIAYAMSHKVEKHKDPAADIPHTKNTGQYSYILSISPPKITILIRKRYY